MAIDRDATLRKAEKLLRQGRLDNAIAEYARVVEESPKDWSTVNALGDLLVRAGQVESAIDQYTRIADHFYAEGFFPRAIAVYKKILKLKPDQEHALLRAADVSEKQGLVADAKSALNQIVERRARRGDKRGAAEIMVRIANVDPSDLAAAMNGARAAAELGDTAGAVERFLRLANEFQQRGKAQEAVQALDFAVKLAPDHPEARAALVTRAIDTGELDKAVAVASSAGEFKRIAAEFASRGRHDDALAVLERALEKDPSDNETRGRLVRAFLSKGDFERARQWLSGELTDPQLLIDLIEIELRASNVERAHELLVRLLDLDPGRREEVVLLGCRLSELAPDAAFHCVDVATDLAIADADWPAAASALHEYVTRVPRHIPALMKLVEVCVDGGLEATMYVAQAQLADAYLDAGRANEARVIAEDLVAREPWERTNLDRFRRALAMLGEEDPDGIIAERLSGDSPFTALDFSFDEPAPPLPPAPVPAADRIVAVAPIEVIEPVTDLDGSAEGRGLDEEAGETIEIDLTDALGGLEPGSGGMQPTAELERVFEDFREEASRRAVGDTAAQQYRVGLAYRDAGQLDEAMAALRQAVRSPRHRFNAAVALGELHRERGQVVDAIEWFERAAEAPSPTPEAGYDLLYELGRLLCDSGETARALAVFLELQAENPEYRDVSTRVEQLSQKA